MPEIPADIIAETIGDGVDLIHAQAIYQLGEYGPCLFDIFENCSGHVAINIYIVNTLSCLSRYRFSTISLAGSASSTSFSFLWKPSLSLLIAMRALRTNSQRLSSAKASVRASISSRCPAVSNTV